MAALAVEKILTVPAPKRPYLRLVPSGKHVRRGLAVSGATVRKTLAGLWWRQCRRPHCEVDGYGSGYQSQDHAQFLADEHEAKHLAGGFRPTKVVAVPVDDRRVLLCEFEPAKAA